MWVSMCRRRSFLFLEAKLHWLHWWGRRLECCTMWACRRGRVGGISWVRTDSSQGTCPLRWIRNWVEYKPDRDLVLCTWGKPEALSLGHWENPVPALRFSLSISVQVWTKGPLAISPSPDILGPWALLPAPLTEVV